MRAVVYREESKIFVIFVLIYLKKLKIPFSICISNFSYTYKSVYVQLMYMDYNRRLNEKNDYKEFI
jgi:hypothetical protein